MDNFIIIANPISGKGSAKSIAEQAYAALTSAGHSGTLALTAGTGDAKRFSQDAVNAGIRKIIACGGDGTLHEVVNGIVRLESPVPKTPQDTGAREPGPREDSAVILGVLPCGRGNDFAAALGVPRKPNAAIQNLLTGKPIHVDIGKIIPEQQSHKQAAPNGTVIGKSTPLEPDAAEQPLGNPKYFITIATCGYDAEVSRRGAERSTPFKGTAAYVYAAIATLANYECPYIKLEGDFGTLEGEHLLAATGIMPRYGGGFRIVPNAHYDDGLFDVCSIRPVPKITILRILVTLFWGGHLSHPAVEIHQTRTLRIETEPSLLLYADGEPMCETPATIEIVKHGLTVLAP